MAVETDLGVGAELVDQRRHSLAHLIEDERPGRVDHVDALTSRVGHDAGLRGESLRRLAVGHHQEADSLEPELAGDAEVLHGDVGLGAVGGDADHRHADVPARGDVVHGADAREHERRDR